MASTEGSPIQSDSSNTHARPQTKTTRLLVQDALEVNKRLQLILTERAEQLERELKEADLLLDASNADEGDEDPEPEVLIPGAKKATAPIPSSEFLSESSPFYVESIKRTAYIANITPHPMKAKELEALASAVRQENERLQAYSRLRSDTGSHTEIDLINNVEGLDWTRIAEKVSSSSTVKRTPTECRITWIGDRHPRINHAEWTSAEVGNLNAIVSEYVKLKKPLDWVKVAETLGTNRTPIDCMRHGLPPHRHNWTPEADQKLIKAVQTCGIDNWQLVARNVSEYATAGQCQGRWQKTLNPALRRGAWTEEEDELLRKAVAGYGKSWAQVSTAIPGRTNDQCRERWTEHVNLSSVKITWSEAEDKQLIELVEELGKQWKSISLKIGGNKTGQNCRMRYDKLKRPTNSKGKTKRSSSLSVVNYVGPISNEAGPSRLSSVESSAPGISTITFSTNLGQHSFSQTPEPSRSKTATVDTNPPRPQSVIQSPTTEESVPPVEARGGPTSAVESTDPEHADSNQLSSLSESESAPRKRTKAVKVSVPDVTQSGEVAPSTKPRPKPRPRVSKKAAAETPDPATVSEDNNSNVNFTPTSSTNVFKPATSKPAKPAGVTRGRKRKNADDAGPVVDKPPQKKFRTSKNGDKQASASTAAISTEPSNNTTEQQTESTPMNMRTDTASRSGDLDDNVSDSSLAPSGIQETSPLRRGRSRKLVSENKGEATIPSHSTAPADLTPKRPRGRPRKVQASG
uniref:Uncharacterized protein n=1 Tax=Psilocybe cubensis TaxID=181762 RepID=A0A8H8CLM0_PSICU